MHRFPRQLKGAIKLDSAAADCTLLIEVGTV